MNKKDIKENILNLIDQQDDQFLQEMLFKLNQMVHQRRNRQMELNPVNVRYKEVVSNKEREKWALEWLY